MSESNVLLDEEVLTDPKIQALLLTVLVRTLANVPPRCGWDLLTHLLSSAPPGHPGQIHHGRL